MSADKAQRYTETVGRRKTSVARVRLTPATKLKVTVNDKDFDVYFPTGELRKSITAAFDAIEGADKYTVTAVIKGGGVSGQAIALRHAISRALIEIDPNLRTKLKVK